MNYDKIRWIYDKSSYFTAKRPYAWLKLQERRVHHEIYR